MPQLTKVDRVRWRNYVISVSVIPLNPLQFNALNCVYILILCATVQCLDYEVWRPEYIFLCGNLVVVWALLEIVAVFVEWRCNTGFLLLNNVMQKCPTNSFSVGWSVGCGWLCATSHVRCKRRTGKTWTWLVTWLVVSMLACRWWLCLHWESDNVCLLVGFW